jgi:RimJ/RimL family protein N-acetyltransferase
MKLSNDKLMIIPYEYQHHGPTIYRWAHSGDYEYFFGNHEPLRTTDLATLKNAYMVVGIEKPNEIYGGIVLSEFKDRDRNLVLHGLLDKQYQHQGLSKSALLLMCYYIFNQMNYYKIICPVVVGNEDGKKAVLGVDFSNEGPMKHERYFDAEFHDVDRFYLLKGTFNRKYRKLMEES